MTPNPLQTKPNTQATQTKTGPNAQGNGEILEALEACRRSCQSCRSGPPSPLDPDPIWMLFVMHIMGKSGLVGWLHLQGPYARSTLKGRTVELELQGWRASASGAFEAKENINWDVGPAQARSQVPYCRYPRIPGYEYPSTPPALSVSQMLTGLTSSPLESLTSRKCGGALCLGAGQRSLRCR